MEDNSNKMHNIIVHIILQIIQLQHVSTCFGLSSGSAHQCFVILISFKSFVILYIYKNHCIRNT
jgi:hypothetical protein